MNTKRCGTCKIELFKSCFHAQRDKKDGLKSSCIKCCKNRQREYYHTVNGLITKIYFTQKRHSKKRGHILPTYSKKELREWITKDDNFDKLFNEWKLSNFNKEFVPSIDRINNKIGYSIDNICLTSWAVNRNRWYDDIENNKNNGDINKISVNQYSKKGNFMDTFISISVASNNTGVDKGDISKCINNKKEYAGGFIWVKNIKKGNNL